MVSAKEYLTDFVNRAKAMEDKLTGITGVLQFDFTADDSGCWAFELKDGKVQPLIEGTVENPTMTITGAFETYYGVKTDKLNPDDVLVYTDGKLLLGKDTSFTLKLRSAGLV